MKTFLFLAGFMLLINGCSYAVSRDLVAQSDKSITLQQIQADPARLAGTTVILGGEIIAIRVAKQGTLTEAHGPKRRQVPAAPFPRPGYHRVYAGPRDHRCRAGEGDLRKGFDRGGDRASPARDQGVEALGAGAGR